MNPHTNELLLLSSFFYLLGIGTLIVIKSYKVLLYKVGVHFVVVSGVVWWLGEVKWILLGAIVFALTSFYSALWFFYKAMKNGICDEKTLPDNIKISYNGFYRYCKRYEIEEDKLQD
jgi:hypothetical protein